jgi:hypothetical protein
VPVNVNVDVSGVEQAAGNIRTRDRERGREWTRRALIVGFFILFLVVFGVASFAALQGDEPFNNVFEVVQYFAPVVTALGGYIAGHYFPAQSLPQIPEGGGSGGQQG